MESDFNHCKRSLSLVLFKITIMVTSTIRLNHLIPDCLYGLDSKCKVEKQIKFVYQTITYRLVQLSGFNLHRSPSGIRRGTNRMESGMEPWRDHSAACLLLPASQI